MPQQKIVLKNCGQIDSNDINSYIKAGGFRALDKALNQFKPGDVVTQVKESGLRGRGGAGFPTGAKWDLTAKAEADEKYVICNADESEVGTFKDRYILDNDPFGLLEGIAIASYAVGAKKAFLYLRAEYSYLLPKLNSAVEQAQKQGVLNRPGLRLDIEICEGAGAYVCGEETSLMESIEGKRGEARFKPPFPPASGLWQKPTVINNVETLMNVPHIINNGSQWFSAIGTAASKGTKVFSVSGDVQRPGVYELIMGSSLKELVVDLAGAKDIKMVQAGGASGRVLPAGKIDTALGFEAVLGAGAIIVYNNSRSALEVALKTMEFFKEESCGKCVPCREGTSVMCGILENMKNGIAGEYNLGDLHDIAQAMTACSLCGLGQAAGNCFVDTHQLFPEEYKV